MGDDYITINMAGTFADAFSGSSAAQGEPGGPPRELLTTMHAKSDHVWQGGGYYLRMRVPISTLGVEALLDLREHAEIYFSASTEPEERRMRRASRIMMDRCDMVIEEIRRRLAEA